jgi:hypothetical protein
MSGRSPADRSLIWSRQGWRFTPGALRGFPIVFVEVSDPLGWGFAAGLPHLRRLGRRRSCLVTSKLRSAATHSLGIPEGSIAGNEEAQGHPVSRSFAAIGFAGTWPSRSFAQG